MERDTIAILDFGSQYTQLITRRLRELQVYSEILPPNTKADALGARGPRGIVLSGGPDSVHQRGAPRCDRKIFGLQYRTLFDMRLDIAEDILFSAGDAGYARRIDAD